MVRVTGARNGGAMDTVAECHPYAMGSHKGGVKNIKVGKCKSIGQILNHVTALISEQFLES